MTETELQRMTTELDLGATVEWAGSVYGMTPEELLPCAVRGGFVSDWAVVNVAGSVRNRLGAVIGRELGIVLVARLFRLTVGEVERILDNVANEIHWREGMDQDLVHAWPKE